MKLLRISDDGAQFLAADGGFATIDQITKEDLLRLVDVTLEQDVELDDYDEARVKNHAQQIVYKNIVEKLQSLKKTRDKFVDESERLYLTEYERYAEDSPESDT